MAGKKMSQKLTEKQIKENFEDRSSHQSLRADDVNYEMEIELLRPEPQNESG